VTSEASKVTNALTTVEALGGARSLHEPQHSRPHGYANLAKQSKAENRSDPARRISDGAQQNGSGKNAIQV
jgi:hypothetical protein